jgi:hypothetical protein
MRNVKTTIQATKRSGPKLAIAAALLGISGALVGCGSQSFVAVPATIRGAALQGKVHGGQQPINGAIIQLYAAGTGGYASAASPLIASTVTSKSDGSFTITGDYTCPSASSLVYITATQGNSGYSNNPNLSMMAALGPCGNLTSSTFIFIDEVTTIGSVWALSPFMTGPANVGSTASNAVGLTNAFADVNTLVNTVTGVAPGPMLPAGASVSGSEIDTLADILAACINSAGGTAGDGSACGSLFSAANPGGTPGSAPTDTITAAMNIAQHPALNVGSLYALATPTAPFQPTLGSQPNDFTIAVNFTGGNLGSPSSLASDSSGNVWVANSSGNTVTELSHIGAVLSGSGYTGSLNAPSAIAIDAAGNVWVANKGNNSVSKLTSTGSIASGSPYTGGGMSLPAGIAFDSTGNAWISNSGNASVTQINNTGSLITNFTGGSAITVPIGIAASPH